MVGRIAAGRGFRRLVGGGDAGRLAGFVSLMMIILAAGHLACPGPVAAGEERINIRFSTWHVPSGADVQQLWIPMLEEMKAKSNGRITYTMFAGGALGKGPDHYDIVRTGLADMGYATLTWTPGRFPLSDVLSAPLVCPAKWKGAEVGMAMYDKMLAREFPDVRVLHINNCVMAHLWTRDPVTNLESLAGKKIRSPGGLQTRAIKALGATPVFMPLGDVYLSMETGVIDGVVTCPALVKAFKLHEVARHGVPISFGCVAEGLFVNKDFWSRVPDDLKPIIEDAGRHAYAHAGVFDEKWYDALMAEFGAKLTIHQLPEAEQARWNERFQNMLLEWAGELEAKGQPAREALRLLRKEVDERQIAFPAYPASLGHEH